MNLMSTDAAPGRVCTLLYNPDHDFTGIASTLPARGVVPLAVALSSPVSADIINEALGAMAAGALALWPNWYDGGYMAGASAKSIEERLAAFLAVVELSRKNRTIEPAWLRKAIALASAGRPPLPTDFPGEITARQLALVLGDTVTALMLDVFPAAHQSGYFGGLPKAAEWLARESGLDVVVVLPRRLAEREDLSPLLYRAHSWQPAMTADIPPAVAPVGVETVEAAEAAGTMHPEEEPLAAERIIGKPHPRSKGEQALAERLAGDPHLQGLFLHNQPLAVGTGARYIVDLLWPDGKVVVEVDGYYYHSNKVEFAADRDRDYRLLISGYRVLRLTHDEILADVDLAVEKIRDVVHFVRNDLP